MMRFKFQLGSCLLFCMMIVSGFTLDGSITSRGERVAPESITQTGLVDFYFVQLTDTHVMHKLFDWKEVSKNRLRAALYHISSFEKKPAFIVISGDLTNWGGAWVSGALNCQAFVSCFYIKEGQLYADAAYTIPVYTTPGNHEYIYTRSLRNYLRYIEPESRYIVNYSEMSVFFLPSGPMGARYPSGGDGLYTSDIAWFIAALTNCTSSMKVVLMHHPAVYFRNDEGRMRDVISRNREAFLSACQMYNVEVVLNGHTHEDQIFDGNETTYDGGLSYNCSLYPTLYVHTDATDRVIHYRNVSVSGTSVWLEPCVEITTH